MGIEAISFVFKKEQVKTKEKGESNIESVDKTHEEIMREINEALKARNAQRVGQFALRLPTETMKNFPRATVDGVMILAEIPDDDPVNGLVQDVEQALRGVEHISTLDSIQPPAPELIMNSYDIKT